MKRLSYVLLLTLLAAPTAAQEQPTKRPPPAESADHGVSRPATPAQNPEANTRPGPDTEQAQPPAQPAQAGQLPEGHPPTGPQGVFQQIGEAREEEQQREREQRNPPPDQMHQILQGQGPRLSSAQATAELPAGSIRVTVLDTTGERAVGQSVDLAILAQGGDRDRHVQMTDDSGQARFDDLPTGTSQAYRVNVSHMGATYSSTPFQLPTDRGYDVRIIRLPTTHSERAVLAVLTRSFLELRDTRLHIIQMVQLANLANETYIFPEEGKEVVLPEGFTAFQSQEVMTDQRIQPTETGFKVRGSLPPGQVQLTWAYDVPLDTGKMELELPLPWRTFTARVETDAPEGLDLEVSGMPDADLHETGGHRLLFTQKRYGPSDPPPDTLRVQLSGIPGPGPMRWIALGAMIILVGTGLMFMFVRGGKPSVKREALSRRRDELLAEAENLEKMFRQDEVGPKFRRRQMDAIVTELASVLRQEDAVRATGGQTSQASKKS